MTQYGTWVSYGGDARTWLAIGLLAVAGGVILAGIRLPLPVRATRPGPAGRIAMILAWVASIVAFLVCVSIYAQQYIRAYHLSAATAAPKDNIAPITLCAVAVVFVVIISRRSPALPTRLAGGFIGAIAAPMIFELPFDLIVMARTYPPIPPDPAAYRALFFVPLFAIEITTLLLLRLSPMVRVTRATFFSFALMLAVFAVWALSGFGYPSAPLPTALNIVSKILAFVTALTLFLPQRPAPGQAPQPDSSEQARLASPPLPLNSAAPAEIPGDPQLTGQPARSSVRGVVRPRCRLLAGAACGVLVLALVTAGCSSAGRPAGAPAKTPGQAAGPVWLCQPGQAPDPCAANPAVSAVTVSGTVRPVARPSSPAASKFACFFVNPTSSLTQTRTGNTGLAVTQLDMYIATEQAAPFSQVCDVWSPMYRSQTFPTVLKGLAGDENLMRSTFTVAYDSILLAWQSFLAHTGSKPIILIGDSQGAAILIHLISARLDYRPSVLRRLLVAILVGGNLQVPAGKIIGSTFTNVPLCTSATQARCAIAFSSYSSQPPAKSVFGRPGQGTSLQSQQTAKSGQQVACVNPAALGGGTGDLDPYLLTASQLGLKEPVPTPWVTYPGLYSATCEQGGGATWLQVTSLAGTSRTRPVVTEEILPGTKDTGPAWGYHGYEYNLALGSLLRDVAGEEAAWQSSH
jgi:Protein of unknown function (DUF3089)